jgi:hypothetical protein
MVFMTRRIRRNEMIDSWKVDVNNPYNNDEAIWKLTQKMRLYEDMVKALVGVLEMTVYEGYDEEMENIKSLLSRAEKLK